MKATAILSRAALAKASHKRNLGADGVLASLRAALPRPTVTYFDEPPISQTVIRERVAYVNWKLGA